MCVCDKSVIIKYAHSAVSFQPTNPSYEAKKLNLGPPKLGHVELCSLHPKREASIEQGAKQPARSTLLPEMPNISKICISFITFQDFPRSKDQDFWILEKFLNFLATLRNVPRWVVENSSL
jgi:hypothetical protein